MIDEKNGRKCPRTVNRRFKDTVFRMLFSDKDNLLSLYNAVNGSNHENADDLEVVTLENAIYMGVKNDLAFILDEDMHMYEHQSTYNPNMPLRDLFYIASEYQRIVSNKPLYSTKLQKIPTPKFIVFYNGQDKADDRVELKLSSAFVNPQEEPALELKVLMLNVNEGHNSEIMAHCHILMEYSVFVAKTRMYSERMPYEKAVETAVDECIREGILKDFLVNNRSEVVMTSIFEYDAEEEMRKLREEYERDNAEELRKAREQYERDNAEVFQRMREAKDEELRKIREEYERDNAEELKKLREEYERDNAEELQRMREAKDEELRKLREEYECSKQVIRLDAKGCPVSEIAGKVGMTEEQVREILA
ncbi:MAG: hypothetical protein ACI4EU_04840 [Butyrivibrio sp.]